MTTPNLDALAKLAPFKLDSDHGDTYNIVGTFVGVAPDLDQGAKVKVWINPDRLIAALNEWAELRATIELVAGNLLAAQEKREDAPMSADTHIDEAITALKIVTGDVSNYSEAAKSLRAKLWSVTGAMAAELADLRAYRERTEAALRDVSQLFRDGFRPNEIRSGMEAVGLWREPGQGATDGN